jgi:hypothetical protein
LVASEGSGLEVSAEKTEYKVMSRDQHAGQNHNIKMGNKSFEMVEQFKYLGITLIYQSSILEEIINSPKSGKVRYNSVHNLLSSRLLSKKNTRIKIYRTITLLSFCMGVKLGLSH